MDRHNTNRIHKKQGFTLIELLVAVAITLFLSSIVYEMYHICLQTYSISNTQLTALQAYRGATDRIEMDLSSIVWKANYVNDTRYNVKPDFKPVHMGLFSIHFEGKEMGFYTSLRTAKVDRVIYYFNPGEPESQQYNGLDDDNDDQTATHLFLMVDDKGSLMVQRTPDEYIVWSKEDADSTTGPAKMAYYLQDGAGPDGYSKLWDPAMQWDVIKGTYVGWGKGNYPADEGDMLCENLSNITFRYAYTDPDIDPASFQYATTWPYLDDDNDGKYDDGIAIPDSWVRDKTGRVYGDDGSLMNNQYIGDPRVKSQWDQRKGLSYLTLPQAVTVEFNFKVGDSNQRMARTFYLYSSLWNEYLDRAETGP